jgi:sn-glycerol 3-phosphate transport system substrate-binding protein
VHRLFSTRSKTRRTLAALVAVLLVGGVLSACSSSGKASSSSTQTTANGRIKLTLWEAMNGSNGAALKHLIKHFNSSQNKYVVKPVFKQDYETTLSDTIAAFRAHHAPNMAQIFDAGTSTLMVAKGAYKPVYKLMKKYNLSFSTDDFIGGAASYYETADNKLDPLPFNSSTPVLYYNKKLFKKAKISSPPKTWDDVGKDARALATSGAKCVLTSSGAYVTWTDFEEFALWNGFHYASQDNGYKSYDNVKLNIDSPPFIKHLTLLGKLAQHKLYRWSGASVSTVPLFTNGTCAMYEQSSADLAKITAGAKFPFGVTELPHVASSSDAPQNTTVGGASMWVMSGAPDNTYKGDAEFLHYLMSTPAQLYWAKHTGYVPVTKAASKKAKANGFYKSHPNDLVAVNELSNKAPKSYTKGIRLGNLPQIRVAENAAVSAVLSGKKSAKAALAHAQSKGNSILSEFASQNGH